MRGRPVVSRILGLVLCLAVSPAFCGGFRDAPDSWLLEAPDAVRLLRGDGIGQGGGWSLEAMQGRLYGMPELSQVGLRAGWQAAGEGGLELGALRQETGGELFRTTGYAGWVRLGQRPRLGLVFRSRGARSQAGDWPAWQRLSATVSVAFPVGRAQARLRAYLPLSAVHPGALPEGREGFLRLAWHQRHWAAVWVVDRDPAGRPCSGWSLVMTLAGGAGVGLRGDAASGVLGVQISLLRGLFLVRTSHLAHPRLGLTHRFALGVVRP